MGTLHCEIKAQNKPIHARKKPPRRPADLVDGPNYYRDNLCAIAEQWGGRGRQGEIPI